MSWYSNVTSNPGWIAAAGAVGAAVVYFASTHTAGQVRQRAQEVKQAGLADTSAAKMAQSTASVMSAPATKLEAPKNDPITPEQLAAFDGSDPDKPVYVAIKGRVFDVSGKREMYGQGGSYHVFAGKDASKGLGMSSLEAKDAVPDYSGLNEGQMKTLDQWETFFEKRYNVVGQVKR